MTIEGNRITDPTTVANKATDAALAPVSPTGTPWLPAVVTKILTAVVVLAAAVVSLAASGIVIPATIVGIATSIVAIGTVFGIASPGLRKNDAPK